MAKKKAEVKTAAKTASTAVTKAVKPKEQSDENPTFNEYQDMLFGDVRSFIREIHIVYGNKVVDDKPPLFIEMKSGNLLNVRNGLEEKLASYFYDINGEYVESSILGGLVRRCKIRCLSEKDGTEVVFVKRTLCIDNSVYFNPALNSGHLLKIDKDGIQCIRPVNVKGIKDPALTPVKKIAFKTPATEFIPLLKEIFRLDDNLIKIIAVYILAVMMDLSVPILVVTGRSGSGKTVLASCIKSIYSPTNEPSNVCSFPSNVEDIAVLLGADRLNVFDNVSEVKDKEISNLLCSSVTKSLVKKRELYSNSNVSAINIFCATIFTGLSQPFKEDDLVSRILEIKAKPFADGERVSPEVLRKRIEELRPRLYGSAFQAIKSYFANHQAYLEKGEVDIPSEARLTDFYAFGSEVMPILDETLSYKDFGYIFLNNQKNNKKELAMEKTVIHAIDNILRKEKGHFTTTAGKLLTRINKEAAISNLGDDIPKSSSNLSTFLDENIALLESIDISFSRCYSHSDKLIVFKKDIYADSAESVSPSFPAPSDPVLPDEGPEEISLDEI